MDEQVNLNSTEEACESIPQDTNANDSRFCTNCGNALLANQKFCGFCGQKVTAPIPSSGSCEKASAFEFIKKHKKAIIVSCVVALVLVLLIVAINIVKNVVVMPILENVVENNVRGTWTGDEGSNLVIYKDGKWSIISSSKGQFGFTSGRWTVEGTTLVLTNGCGKQEFEYNVIEDTLTCEDGEVFEWAE